jgi:uncharacterized DUF497 family protein
MVEGDFEWDSVKAAASLVKHGVSFAEAATVFADTLAVYLDDGSGSSHDRYRHVAPQASPLRGSRRAR